MNDGGILDLPLVGKPLTGEVDFSGLKLQQNTLDEASVIGDNLTDYLKGIYQKELDKNPNAKCPSCGGVSIGEPCDVCGVGMEVTKLKAVETIDDELRKELFIPDKYKTTNFISSKLLSSKKEFEKDSDFNKYVQLLDSILIQTERGSKQLSSLFISAPADFGKETFAYTLLQLGLLSNQKVFPYLDLNEVGRLVSAYNKGDMRDPIIDDIGFSDIDLYTADVCVLKVPHFDFFHSYRIMLSVIDRRARRGLPTIILSRYSFNYFTSADKNKETESIVNNNKYSPKNLRLVNFHPKSY